MKVIDLMCKLDPLTGCTSVENLKEFAKLIVQIRQDPEFWKEILKLAGLKG